MSFAFDLIRIRHSGSFRSIKRMDRIDRKHAELFNDTLQAFADIDSRIQTMSKRGKNPSKRLVDIHSSLFFNLDRELHSLVVNELTELEADTRVPRRVFSNLITLFEAAVNSGMYSEKARLRMQRVIANIEEMQTTYAEIGRMLNLNTDMFIEEMRGSSSLQHTNKGFQNEGSDLSVLSHLRHLENWKNSADRKLAEYTTHCDNFERSIRGLQDGAHIAKALGRRLNDEELSNLFKLSTLVRERVSFSKNILHYFILLYHRLHAYKLSEAEQQSLKRDERSLAKLMSKLASSAKKLMPNMGILRPLSGKLAMSTLLVLVAAFAAVAAPPPSQKMIDEALSLAKSKGTESTKMNLPALKCGVSINHRKADKCFC